MIILMHPVLLPAQPDLPLPSNAPGDKKELTIAYRLDSAPMQFQNEKGQADGILIDFWRLWSIKSGIPVNFVGAYNAQAQQMVLDGEADLNAGLFKNQKRAEVFDFTIPVISSAYTVFYQKDLQVASLEDFKSLTLGVTRGSYHEHYLREYYPQLNLVLFDGYQALFEAAVAGNIQGFVTQAPYLQYFLSRHNPPGQTVDVFKKLDKALYVREYQGAVKKGNTSLVQTINTYMAQINQEDRRVIMQYWLGKQATKKPSYQINTLDLTTQEKAWLSQHPVIDIGVDGNWPPVDFLDAKGRHTGIAHDFLTTMASMLGIRFNPIPGPSFNAMLNKVQTGELKVGMTIVKTQEREKNLWFTEPYFSAHKIIVSRSSAKNYRSPEALSGKTVAMEAGYYSVELIKKRFPEIHLKLVSSTLDALKEVSWGQADAYIGNGAVVQWLINEYQLANLEITGDAGLKPSAQRFAIYKDKQWQPLVSILNKALAQISREQRKQISQKWMGITSPEEDIVDRMKLSKQQWQWLKHHPVIRLGIDKAWPPIEFVDHNGQYRGLSSDFIKQFTQALGVELTIDHALTWNEVIEGVKSRQLDVLPALVKTPEREKFLNFTRPYLYFSTVIFVNDGRVHTTTLQDLHGKKVGVERSYVTHELLKKDHPEIKLVLVKNNRDGLEQVARGKIDAYIGNLTTSSYLISQFGISNVKVGGTTPYALELRMGVRKDWPELAQILDKFLGAMSEEDIAQLRHKWLTVKYNVEVDYSTIRNTIIIAAVLLILSFLWIFYIRQKNTVLKSSEEQLNRIINTIPLAIILSDTRGKILRANPYVNNIMRSQDSVVGRNIGDFYANPDEQQSVLQQLHKTGRIKDFQVHIKTDTGESLTGLLSAISLHLGDKKVNLGVFVDLTERIKMEEELKHAKEVSEQANHFKTRFLANMSHEIRTPMNAILGMTHLILQTGLNDRQYDYINKIDISARNLLAIINDILDISKIEAGKVIIEKTTFNLDEVLQQLLDMVSIKAQEKNVQISIEKETSIPVNLLGDPLRLGQVLLNLVQNAIKFTEYGSVTIKVDSPDQSDSRVYLHFSVVDTGIGIAQEKLDTLFEPFVQADNSISRQYGGTGLGLSISRQLVALMGGELKAKSEQGKGSTFEFSLEFERQKGVSEAVQGIFNSTADKKIPIRRLKGKILLVEDNAINQQVARELLESFGLLVMIADNGQDALDKLQDTDFDMIIMDVQMPVMDGLEATRILRQNPRYKYLPVIAMTAHAMDGDKEACLKAGMNDYLPKPIDPDELMKLLSNWLDSYNVLGMETSREYNDAQDITFAENIPGIDLSWGLKRVGGNKKLFMRLLNDFYVSHHDACEKTRHYLANNNIEAARRQVHTIQGVSGNIGARQLQEAAKILEAAIRADEHDINTYLALSESFCQEAETVFDALRKLNANPVTSVSEENKQTESVDDCNTMTDAEKEHLLSLITRLQSLLNNGDFDAQKVVQDIILLLKKCACHQELSVFEQIADDIQSYDFERAEQSLQSLQNMRKNDG